MTPFVRMVQNKRAKMLALSILLTVAVFVHQSESINLTYIVRKEGGRLQPNCIAEENERYEAVGWVYPLPKSKDDVAITTKFVPTIQNGFNCKFSKGEKCNRIWALKNWELDENSTRTLDLLFDGRWEDFPTIFTGNGAKEFEEKTEIPNIFKAGISVIASSSIEILICEGWNPYSYACYHLNITKTRIFLRKFMTFPKNVSESDTKILDSYEAFSNILSGDEWRNFVVNLNDKGVLSLLDVSINRTVIQYEDKAALKPLYLLVRSEKQALWKIHQNQFMYTKTAQTSRLGPTLNLPSKEMCVALYVSLCPKCAMSFFLVKNNERKFLSEVLPSAEAYTWRMVKLKDDQILTDKLNIFVETKFTENNESEGFWAIDDVRVCHENEVKVTFLKLKNSSDDSDEVSCQIVQHPKWRPKKLVYSKIRDFPDINNTTNPTSIFLNWTQEDPNNQINYFIQYEANDLCPDESPNLRRVKSNGFLMTKHNEITINNLIPYTKYNVTFSSMLHENEKQITLTTLETEQATLEELPAKLNVQVTDSQAYVSWEKIPCQSIYGPILYSLNVTNLKTNKTKEVGVLKENTIEISDLEPFTSYVLSIKTARNFEELINGNDTIDMTTTFTTLPGKSLPVHNLELYAVDKSSVAFRYDLPKVSRGVPVAIQITRCNALSFSKCKTYNFEIKKCKLFEKKYCVELGNLIHGQSYNFKISLRNEGMKYYGDEVKAEAFIDERVPGAPSNITYRVVDCKEDLDYCHLNISWLHPYYQNGSIESFHLVLNGTDTTTKNIQEVLKIFNSSYYLPRYEHQVKYIPYSTNYDLYIQSVNSKFKSAFAQTQVKTDDIGDHIDQSPSLILSNPDSVTFNLPLLDHRLKSYTLTTVVQDFNHDLAVPHDIKVNKKVIDHLCHNFGDTWVLEKTEISTRDARTLEIGTGAKNNRYLEPQTHYCVTFIFTNKYKNSEHDVVYIKKLVTPEGSVSEASSSNLYWLFLLVLLIPIGFFTYRYFSKKRTRKSKNNENNKENVYESLPFEECEENCVNNETYDHLLHK